MISYDPIDDGPGSRLRRFTLTAPGWPLHIAVTTMAVLTLWQASLPGLPNLFFLLACIACWIVVGGVWTARLLAYLVESGSWRIPRVQRMRWATAPILVGITFGLWVFGIPLDARFALGRSELDLFASSVLERGDSINPPARVGTYRIQRWSVDRFDEGSVRFLVKERGMDGLSGFAFSPNERPRRSNGDRYYHLQGPWYVWEARFD